jgi:hypothetical protein
MIELRQFAAVAEELRFRGAAVRLNNVATTAAAFVASASRVSRATAVD